MINRMGSIKGFMTPVSMGFLLLLSLILTGHLWSISLSKSRVRKNQNIVFLHNKINQSLPDFEAAAGVLASLCAVDLDEVDGGVVGQEVGGGLGELGLQALAVAAPDN